MKTALVLKHRFKSMFRQGELLDVAPMDVDVQLSGADTQKLTTEWVSLKKKKKAHCDESELWALVSKDTSPWFTVSEY